MVQKVVLIHIRRTRTLMIRIFSTTCAEKFCLLLSPVNGYDCESMDCLFVCVQEVMGFILFRFAASRLFYGSFWSGQGDAYGRGNSHWCRARLESL
jgi:hypothetical protein